MALPPGDKSQRNERDAPAGAWPFGLRLALAVLVTAVLLAPLIIWREAIAGLFGEREAVIAALRAIGAWGPVALVGLYVAQVIAAPIPGQAINFVAGALYGFWPGLGYSWAGMVLGSTAAMGLARLAGRPLIVRLVGPAPLERLDRLAAGRGLGFFFLVFLIPGLPDDAACFLAGLTRLPLAALIMAAALGRTPGIVAAVWAGATAERLGWTGWVGLIGLSLAAAWLAWRYGERIQGRLLRAVWPQG